MQSSRPSMNKPSVATSQTTAAGAAAGPGHGRDFPGAGGWAALLAQGTVTAGGLAALFSDSVMPGGAWPAATAAVAGVVLGAALPVVVGWRWAQRLRAGAERAAHAGLARPLFLEFAHREWARARRYGSGAALLMVEVDRYAALCESRGVGAGEAVMDELLRVVAPGLRPADIVTRYGPSQIAVLLAHADATGALDVAERIRERAERLLVQTPREASLAAAAEAAQTERMASDAAAGLGRSPAAPGPPAAPGLPGLRLTVSTGVAHLRPAHLSLQALLDDAEDALGIARQAGGNCVRAAPVDSMPMRSPGFDERRTRPRHDGKA